MLESQFLDALRPYYEAFAEKDESQRLRLLQRSMTPDAEIWGPKRVFAGYAQISEKIAGFHTNWPGCRLVLDTGLNLFLNSARLCGVIVGPDNGVRARGDALIELAPDGRIGRVIPFWEALPPLPAPWPVELAGPARATRGFENLPLETERLILRPLRPDDAAALFAIYADAEVMRYWSTPPWTELAQAAAMIERETKALADGEHLRLALQTRSSGALVGACTLFSFSESSRRAEVGYILGAGSWGQGLMSEALARLIDYAFDDLKLNRLEADIDPRNAASEKILQRMGFTKEGHLRERWIVAGEVSDTALYGLLQSDWRRRP
jgi:ribosomal-protein-alanine N-acetyltransferase